MTRLLARRVRCDVIVSAHDTTRTTFDALREEDPSPFVEDQVRSSS